MQLRRGPPPVRLVDAKTPALRLVKAPRGPVGARPGRGAWRQLNSYTFRIVAGALLVSVPTAVILGFVMANWSAQTSIEQAKSASQRTAASSAVRINDWMAERRAELRVVAQSSVSDLSKPGLNARLTVALTAHPTFEILQVNDVNDAVIASTRPSEEITSTPSGSPFATSLSVETMGP